MFIAYIEQEGEGCDYTIGCGVRLVEFGEVNEMTYEEVINYLRREYLYEDPRIKSITLYEVSQKLKMPVSEWYNEKDHQEALEIQRKQREKDLEEYERLRRLFEP